MQRAARITQDVGKRDYAGSRPIIYLDVSRLIWRAFQGNLTGIDRVELAYSKQLQSLAPGRTKFVAFSPAAGLRVLPATDVSAFVASLDEAWQMGRFYEESRTALALALKCVSPFPGENPALGDIYLNVSGFPLWSNYQMRRIVRTGVRIITLIHDAIPLSHPEYVPPAWTRRHAAILEQVRSFASGVITNSHFTAETIRPFLPEGLPLRAIHLGTSDGTGARSVRPLAAAPYFVVLGTIEPRKNHITLLHAWRELAASKNERSPRLVIAGRIDWDCEHVLKLVRSCPILREHVELHGWLPDQEIARLLAGAKALLAPSFVEGFGLPVAEALAMGVPVICSDIPAHREVGGRSPDYVAPVDTLAWIRAVREYASSRSTARAAQLSRLKNLRKNTWSDHVEQALVFIDEVVGAGHCDDRTTASGQGKGKCYA